MAERAGDRPDAAASARVSHAMVVKEGDQSLRSRLYEAVLWVFIDLSRLWLIAFLAVGVYVTTMLVGVFGPASIRQFLLDGTSIANAYIELQPGIITAITVVLAVNQLVLSPEFGSIGHQRQRLVDALEHRRDVEDTAGVISSPTDPAGYLRTIIDATRERLNDLEAAVEQVDDRELTEQVTSVTEDMHREIRHVSDTLGRKEFGHIEFLGAAIHFDTTRDMHRMNQLQRMYRDELTTRQVRAFDEVSTALKQYDIAREYFRTRYLQTQFIWFSLAMLLIGPPAIMVAHYSIGIIGPGVLTGATFGVTNLLWFEAGTFTAAMLPVFVIVSFVARISTLAETSIFVGPFSRTGSDDSGS